MKRGFHCAESAQNTRPNVSLFDFSRFKEFGFKTLALKETGEFLRASRFFLRWSDLTKLAETSKCFAQCYFLLQRHLRC